MDGHTDNEGPGGFTLVELLAVIAVIAILTALSLRYIGAAMERAHLAKCAGNLRALGHSLLLYASDHQTRLPAFDEGGVIWDTQVLPYLGENKTVFLCPRDPHLTRSVLAAGPRTYAANGGQKYVAGMGYPFGGFDGQPPLSLDEIQSRSGRTILMGERPGDSAANRGLVGGFAFCTLDQLPGALHREASGANYLFADGSVEFLEATDIALSEQSDHWYCPTP